MTEPQQWIVRVGDRSGTTTFRGPWPTLEEANDWAIENLDEIASTEFGIFTPAAHLHTTAEQWAAEDRSEWSA